MNNSTARISRLTKSLSQDVVFAVTRGRAFQVKHFLLALGLHNLTGSRKVIDIVHKFGHCLNYNSTCEIETAQAEVAQENLQKGTFLPVQPVSEDKFVFSHFWVDNFDVLIDKQVGGGSVHTTHLVAFQEKSDDCVLVNNQISVPRRKTRHLFIDDSNINSIPIEKKKEPT